MKVACDHYVVDDNLRPIRRRDVLYFAILLQAKHARLWLQLGLGFTSLKVLLQHGHNQIVP